MKSLQSTAEQTASGLPSTANGDEYTIEKNILIPRRIKARRYPFGDMDVGDSFALESSDIATLERVRAAASYFGIRNVPKKFSVRIADPVAKSYRCWRIV